MASIPQRKVMIVIEADLELTKVKIDFGDGNVVWIDPDIAIAFICDQTKRDHIRMAARKCHRERERLQAQLNGVA